MRIGKIAWAVAFVVLALLGWQLWRMSNTSTTAISKSTEDRSVFFRLVSKYQHGEEMIDFDIVVGCAVRVTGYGYGGSSYDAFRDPIFFVKETGDGAAVMQLVPDACQGQTTENGEVPGDFMPGVLWFDDAKDLSLGIGYVSEDAFENENSELKFLGSSIHKATRAEWEAFQPTAARNLLDQRPFIFGAPAVSATEVAHDPWNKENLKRWLPRLSCKGLARYRVTDPVLKDMIAGHWPQDRPAYWAPSPESGMEFVDVIDGGKGPMVDGVPLRQHMRSYHQNGFATRAQGGQFYSGKAHSALPSKVYPLRAEDGVPWMDSHLADATTIYRDVDLLGGSNAGFVYCYASLLGTSSGLRDQLVPGYMKRQFNTRVDGVPVETQGSLGLSPANPPTFFFEKDEYFYLNFGFHLS
jgi:hypothetical protein